MGTNHDTPRCSFEGCTTPAHARGLCPKHYQRWRKHGDPEKARRYSKHPEGGDCFQVALNLGIDEYGGDITAHVCHGLPEGQAGITGRIAHAWVEYERDVPYPMLDGNVHRVLRVLVDDRSNGHNLQMDQSLYYKIGRLEPEHVRRYSLQEAWRLATETGHYGPWDDKIWEEGQ